MSSPSGSTTDLPRAGSAEHRGGHGPWKPAIAASRLVIAAGAVVVGILAGATNLTADTPIDSPFLLFAAVLTLGGTTLLGLPRLRPGRAGWLAGGATTLIGLVLAAFLPVRETCCDSSYTFSWGLPMPWTTAGGDTPRQAYANMAATLHQTDTLSAAADMLFWVYAGLIVGVVVGLLRRALRARLG